MTPHEIKVLRSKSGHYGRVQQGLEPNSKTEFGLYINHLRRQAEKENAHG